MKPSDLPDPETVKIGLLLSGAALTLAIVGNAIGKSLGEDTWTVDYGPETPSVARSIGFGGATTVGLLLVGDMVRKAIDEYGAKQVGYYAAGLTGIGLVGVVVRKLRDA
jgi:hypothetical protein